LPHCTPHWPRWIEITSRIVVEESFLESGLQRAALRFAVQMMNQKVTLEISADTLTAID
jgi:hypothetical protein